MSRSKDLKFIKNLRSIVGGLVDYDRSDSYILNISRKINLGLSENPVYIIDKLGMFLLENEQLIYEYRDNGIERIKELNPIENYMDAIDPDNQELIRYVYDKTIFWLSDVDRDTKDDVIYSLLEMVDLVRN